MSSLTRQTVTTIDDALTVYFDHDLNSGNTQLAKGIEIQLGTISDIDGREWFEVTLPDGSGTFALGSSIRNHTDIAAELPSPPDQPEKEPLSEKAQWIRGVAGVVVAILAITIVQNFSSIVQNLSLHTLVYGIDGVGIIMVIAGILVSGSETKKTLMAFGVLIIVAAQFLGRLLSQ